MPDHSGQPPTAKVARNRIADTTAAAAPTTVRIFGHVLDVCQRRNLTGTARVWLLLRHLDKARPDGQAPEGRISKDAVRQALTAPHGRLKCLSWKRLRQILNSGENKFWHRSKDNQQIHYYSESRVAAHLGLNQIRGWAVEIPIEDLTQKIADVRALFYDAFHSARGDGYNQPISRGTMERRGNGDDRTQRKYETAREIEKQANFAKVGRYSKEAWEREKHAPTENRVGGPAFIFIDYKGILGRNPHRRHRPAEQRHWHHIYIARRIANAYCGTLRTVKRGRKWTNQKLKHLCQSMSPTGSFAEEDCVRLYHDTAARAQRTQERHQSATPVYHRQDGHYWQEETPPWQNLSTTTHNLSTNLSTGCSTM